MVDVTAARKLDFAYGKNQEGFFNFNPKVTQTQVTTTSGYQYTLKYTIPQDDPRVKAVKVAVEMVTAKGFQLPPIEFRLGENNNNIAIKGDAAGNFSVVVYLGNAAIHCDKKTVTAKKSGIAGGQGANRGVAHAVYDGTQRWFGNPKQHAMAVVVVVHELGHVMHDANDEQAHWASMSGNYRPDIWMEPAKKVSQYAGKSGGELVAEVFAGTFAGKRYPQDVIVAYRALSGAEVPGFF